MKKNPEQQLKSILGTVELLGKCHICVHDFYRHILEYIPDVPLFHQNWYCTGLKKKLPDQERRCIKFDREAVCRHLTMHRGQFFKLCPCQVLELVVPIWKGKDLCGVIFLGPYRAADTLPPDSLIAPARDPAGALKDKPMPLDKQGMEHIANLGLMLSSYITEIIGDVKPPPVSAPAGRKGAIEQFIAVNFNRGISMEMLAEFLELSESRTGRLLKEYFNAGLTELVNKQRLNYAINTLQRAEVPVREAARRAGFDRIEYFHRLFKEKTGMTPGEFRRRHRLPEPGEP